MNDLHIVKDVKIEDTLIHICSNSFVGTKELESNIIENFSRIAYQLCGGII